MNEQQTPFLPKSFGNDSDFKKSLAAKVLYSYQTSADVTRAGKHAAEQLLLRLRYIIFQGSVDTSEVVVGSSTRLSSYSAFDHNLLQASQSSVTIPKLMAGACPRKDIFNRPILRSCASRCENGGHDADRFPSALMAAQEFSFGSTKVRHAGPIDVVQIANNIANSANGQKTQSYSFVWNWKQHDTTTAHQRGSVVPKRLYRRHSSDSFLSFHSPKSRSGGGGGFAKTVLSRLNLDRLCGSG